MTFASNDSRQLGGHVTHPTRVLVAAGRSSHGVRALRRGIALAIAMDRPLVVWSVIPEREARSIQFLSRDAAATETVCAQFAERLRAEAEGLGARGVSLSIEVRVGDPEEVLRAAASDPSDLLVLGRGSETRTALAPLGNTTYHLVRNVACSVWVEPSTWEVSEGPVLVAMDGSRHGQRALQRAHALAGSLGSELRVVHVHRREEAASAGERCAEWVSEALGPSGARVSVETHEGDPTQGIERACATDPPALLVLSSLGEGSLLTRWMLGGTVYQVLRQMGCPVLVDRETS